MRKKGFTLIELIVVMAIISILVLLGVPKYKEYINEARLTRIKVEAKELEIACQKYYMRYDDWPRLTNEPFTAEQITEFGEKILDKTGRVVSLDSNGNYYDIDYDKISNYIKEPNEGYTYILQNPVGSIFYIEGVTESRKYSKDTEYIMANKPEAVISIEDEGSALYLGEVINWSHSESITPEGTIIDKVEWVGKESIYNAEGTYTVELRVRNNLGIWSDWVFREIKIIKRTIFNGLSPEAYDGDNTTKYRSAYSTLKEVTWNESLDNKVLLLDLFANVVSSKVTAVSFYDSQGTLLSFIDLSGSIETIKSLKGGRNTYAFVIPNGARKLSFNVGASTQGLYVDVYEIGLAEQTTNPKPITNLESTELNYAVTLNWEQNEPNYSYSIILRDGKYHDKVNGFTYTDAPLYSNQKYIYTIIAIDKWGNASEWVEKQIITTSDTIEFRGLGATAFDDNSSTNFISTYGGLDTVTWQKDLAGRTIVLDCSSSGASGKTSTVYVYNSEGQAVPFLVNDVEKSSILLSSSRTTYKLQLPEGAVKLVFYHGASSTAGIRTTVYAIKVE